MAYEGAGIRFTDAGDSGQRPRQAPTQDAVQLLRLRLPSFSGAPPPAVPPGLMAGGMGSPMAAMPGGSTMPPDLARQLQTVMRLLAMPNTPPGQAQSFSGGGSPAAALQSILRGQTFGQNPGQMQYPSPKVQYQPAPIYSPQLPFNISYVPPGMDEQSLSTPGSPGPAQTPVTFGSGLSGLQF